MADLSQLSTEQLEVYRDLLKQKQQSGPGATQPAASDESDDDLLGWKNRGVGPQRPSRFERVAGLVTGGGILAPPQHRGDEPITRLADWAGSTASRTGQAWKDMFTGQYGPSTAAEMVPVIGPTAVDAVNLMATPGHRLEGLATAATMLWPAYHYGGTRQYVPGVKSVEEPMGPGLSTPAVEPKIPDVPKGVKTAAKVASKWVVPDVPLPSGYKDLAVKAAGKGYNWLREKSGSPAKTTETRLYSETPFDTSISPESMQEMYPERNKQWTGTPSDLIPKKEKPPGWDGFRLTEPPHNFAKPDVPEPTKPTLTRHDLELLGQGSLDLRDTPEVSGHYFQEKPGKTAPDEFSLQHSPENFGSPLDSETPGPVVTRQDLESMGQRTLNLRDPAERANFSQKPGSAPPRPRPQRNGPTAAEPTVHTPPAPDDVPPAAAEEAATTEQTPPSTKRESTMTPEQQQEAADAFKTETPETPEQRYAREGRAAGEEVLAPQASDKDRILSNYLLDNSVDPKTLTLEEINRAIDVANGVSKEIPQHYRRDMPKYMGKKTPSGYKKAGPGAGAASRPGGELVTQIRQRMHELLAERAERYREMSRQAPGVPGPESAEMPQ